MMYILPVWEKIMCLKFSFKTILKHHIFPKSLIYSREYTLYTQRPLHEVHVASTRLSPVVLLKVTFGRWIECSDKRMDMFSNNR